MRGGTNSISFTPKMEHLTIPGAIYGTVQKFTISDKVFLYVTHDALTDGTGTFTVDTSVKTGDTTVVTPLYDLSRQLIVGYFLCDVNGVHIVTQTNYWMFGEMLVVLR